MAIQKTPYANPVTPITDLTPFFEQNKKTGGWTFVGETLEIRIPKRFEVYDLLSITDTVTSLGIMDLVINGRYQCGMVILNQIQIEPSEITEMEYNGVPYVVLHLTPGDRFIPNPNVVKEDRVIYAIYVEFDTCGKPIYFLNYDQLGLIFDKVKLMTGSGLGVDRVVYEVIIAHLARDRNNLYLPYRLTDMKQPFALIPLKQVTHSTTNTTARLIGSYFSDTLAASLVTTTTENYPFEDVLRGLPISRPLLDAPSPSSQAA